MGAYETETNPPHPRLSVSLVRKHFSVGVGFPRAIPMLRARARLRKLPPHVSDCGPSPVKTDSIVFFPIFCLVFFASGFIFSHHWFWSGDFLVFHF
jgi:hypothetical protein